ncbi:hypothetical protein PsAD14_04639 [Pseudovibrio sp. Ad14]|nr:hypothetical protein PsW74_05436 [Pseudovibrio sp. W74]KZL07171.1 hypothetical protein PsAD14_04639 [Pseudovibrio sp. Ad14]
MPPFVHPIRRGTIPLFQALSGAVGLKVRCIDHQNISFRACGAGQLLKDLFKTLFLRPAHKPVT